jgi:hypothetical protein
MARTANVRYLTEADESRLVRTPSLRNAADPKPMSITRASAGPHEARSDLALDRAAPTL